MKRMLAVFLSIGCLVMGGWYAGTYAETTKLYRYLDGAGECLEDIGTLNCDFTPVYCSGPSRLHVGYPCGIWHSPFGWTGIKWKLSNVGWDVAGAGFDMPLCKIDGICYSVVDLSGTANTCAADNVMEVYETTASVTIPCW